MAKTGEDTPLLKQYFSIKAQHPEAILLYRVGDFYETYADDAVTASKVLGLVLTRRSNDRKAVLELTERLRQMRPDDPVWYDYALFGIGVTARKPVADNDLANS